MPHLQFYAYDRDRRDVLDVVFASGDFAVFEMYSQQNQPIRRFDGAADVPEQNYGAHLMLHVVDAGGQPILDAPARHGVVPIGGWGLVQLSFGGFFEERELRWSVTNHNSLKRAQQWADSQADMGDPKAWDWAAIVRTSARLNRRIKSMAVTAVGPRPVLPAAAALIDRRGLAYEYGTGLHGCPVTGRG